MIYIYDYISIFNNTSMHNLSSIHVCLTYLNYNTYLNNMGAGTILYEGGGLTNQNKCCGKSGGGGQYI